VTRKTLLGTARITTLYGLAGAAYFVVADAIYDNFAHDLIGGPYLHMAMDLGFVAGSVLLLRKVVEAQYARLRRVNEGLESRVAGRSEDLRREVAERARAEATLRSSEQRFRDIAEAASDWIWEMDADLRFTYVSKRFAEVTGCPTESLLGKTPAELFLDTLAARSLSAEALAHHRAFRNVAVEMAVPGGARQLELSGRPVTDLNGAYAGYRGTGSDVTEQRRAELSAERLRHRQELILTSLGEGVFGLDRDGRFTFVNPAAQEVLGWTGKELGGRSAEDVLSPDPAAGLTVDNGDAHRRRVSGRFRRKDGTCLPVDYVWTAVVEDGQTIGAVVAFRDITEQQRIDAELIAAKDGAEAATRAKSEFLAHMSHELRTPLNSIIGFADVMMGEYFGPIGNVRYKDYVSDIRHSGEHLRDLINDMVDLARIEAGKLALDLRPCDIAELVDEALAMIRPLAALTNCSVINNVPGNLPPFVLDPRRFKQVLLNLLSNGVKFTPEGGRVGVTAEMGADGGLVVRVTDTGIGIPPDELELVTQVFVQGNNSVAREKGGAGLGLPLAKQLVELHGGHLKIDSDMKAGTTVSLHLPPGRLTGGETGNLQPALVEHGAD